MIWPTDIPPIESWILICTTALLVKLYFHRKWTFLKHLNIPHDPPSLLNLGNIASAFSEKYFTYVLERKKKYGRIWGYYIITKPRIVVHDLEILRQICVKEFSNFGNRQSKTLGINGKEFANGLLLVDGGQWKRIRTTLAPTFSSVKMRQMFGIVNWCVGNTLKVFKKKAEIEGGCFTAKDVFSRLSLDVICSAAFSTDVNSQEEGKDESPISKNAKKFFRSGLFGLEVFIVVAFPFLLPLFTWKGSRMPHVSYFRQLCRRIIAQRDEGRGAQGRVDLLQLMVDAKLPDSELKSGTLKGLSSTEIVGNAMTMLLAGYETTGTAMTYFAYNLATHPEVQRKLQKEIDQLYNEKGELDYDSVTNLKYLDMCVYESLRIYCPVARTIRSAKNDITLSGLTIPSGSVVDIPIYALCNDPEFWDSPKEFDPERMRIMGEIDPIVFQPFGQGPRNCIGSRFAIMEIKLAFCKILHQFTLEATPETPKPPLKLKLGVTTCPTVDIKLRAVPRL